MPPKILLVDDVNMFLELQKGFLKLSTAHVLTARDGMEAFEIVKTEFPSLVIMDLHMPRMDGAECCTRLKADPRLKSVPVIMVTAAGKDEDRDLCIKAGCDDFLTKPLDRLLYLEIARKYLPTINRRNPRVPCRVKAKFKAFGVSLSSEILDVSDNGVYMATNYDIEVGTTIDVVFSLPDENGTIIQAGGRVAWLNTPAKRMKSDLPMGFGIEFIVVPNEMRGALNRFVKGTQ